jgi:glycosyltransferase involved in cell wall biosynthesis
MTATPNVLFVIDSLGHSGPARQLTHLASALGGRVHALDFRRPLDVRPIWDVGRLRRPAPDAVHAWTLRAAWAVVLGGLCRPSRLTVSAALPQPGSSPWPARLLLRRVSRVVAFGAVEADGYRRLGVPADRISVVPPSVPIPQTLPAPAKLPGLPDDARVILCVGPSRRHKGHRDAAWAIDVLHLLEPRAHLVIVGSGDGLDAVRRLKRANDMRHVHLAGEVPDVLPWLARADVVWVPSLLEGGRYAALEAMAAGRPVVASRLPGLAELIEDGRSGLLSAPGDKPDLCRKTRRLLEDSAAAKAMGDEARRRVAERFSLAATVEGFAASGPRSAEDAKTQAAVMQERRGEVSG